MLCLWFFCWGVEKETERGRDSRERDERARGEREREIN
jgi:hypothetical protein